MPNWLLHEYADLLARPITSVPNSSFSEQRLPQTWKLADVVPIPKEQKVEDISKHLRPISLTPSISKLAEDFVVSSHFGPAVLEAIDPDQFGEIPKSSTTQALASMLHQWLEATDSTGAAVRVVLFDYRKAFDLIDHGILVQKIQSLSIPRGVAQWVFNFLTSRKQHVKLSSSCYSNWELMPAGVPPGTKLGPWLFLLMINDLRIPGVPTWKFVDDTTIAEIVPRGNDSHAQHAVNYVAEWSSCNLMQLNAAKCKELVIDFKKCKHSFEPLFVSDKNLTVVQNAKILGLTISNNLTWNTHIGEIIKKANKRMYFLELLRKAGVPLLDIVNFYCTCVRPLLECAPVFHHALPSYLSEDLERIQKRALNVISPGHSYCDTLACLGLKTLRSRRQSLCLKFFQSILSDKRFSNLVPPRHKVSHNLRHSRTFSLPRFRTDRYQRSFIPAMSKYMNS